MGAKSAVISPGKISDKTVRQQLTRILVSKTFSQVDRLKRFVDFIVSETVEGRGGDLKEYVIGVQVFGKEASFDPRTDPIVRVQARRLRARLARYYLDEGNSDEVVVDLPKGGYAPETLRQMAQAQEPPFDFIFIDADKPGYVQYMELVMPMARPGTVIVADNLIRNGLVMETNPSDDNAKGARAFKTVLAAHPRLESTIVPIIRHTIDGMSISIVR